MREYLDLSGVRTIQKGIATIVVAGVLLAGIDYLIENYRERQGRIQIDPFYRAQVLQEREQEERELKELDRKLMEGWRDKHKVPFLDKLLWGE